MKVIVRKKLCVLEIEQEKTENNYDDDEELEIEDERDGKYLKFLNPLF